MATQYYGAWLRSITVHGYTVLHLSHAEKMPTFNGGGFRGLVLLGQGVGAGPVLEQCSQTQGTEVHCSGRVKTVTFAARLDACSRAAIASFV